MKHYKNVREILLISLSCIGDVLLTTPVMRSLKDNFPGANLTVAAGPTAMAILEKHDLVNNTFTCENKGRHKGWRGLLLMAKELRAKKYDMVVDLRNTGLPYLLRTRYRIASHKAHFKNRNADGRHAVDRHLDVLELAGLGVTSRKMEITVPAEVKAKVAAYLSGKGLADRKLAAIYPGAGSAYKMYPVEKMAQVLEMLDVDESLMFVAIGAGADAPVCEKLEKLSGGAVVSVAGDLNILETGALLQACVMMISNDSGPMHLAAAVDTPTVALFGPTDAKRYGPRGDMHRIVWQREDCNPCKRPECGHESCIEKIMPEQIARAVAEISGLVKFKEPTEQNGQMTLYE